jgi:hypothetical protein
MSFLSSFSIFKQKVSEFAGISEQVFVDPVYDERQRRFRSLLQQVKNVNAHLNTYTEQVRDLLESGNVIAADLVTLCRGTYVEPVPEGVAGNAKAAAKSLLKTVHQKYGACVALVTLSSVSCPPFLSFSRLVRHTQLEFADVHSFSLICV